MSNSPNSKRYLTPREAVAEGYFGSEKQAANLRSQRKGPQFSKPSPGKAKSGRVVYDRHDLDAWIQRGRILTLESEPVRFQEHKGVTDEEA